MEDSPLANRLRVLGELLHWAATAGGEETVTLTFKRTYAIELAESLDEAADIVGDAG